MDVMCSWCHAINSTFETFCLFCGHRADLPRSACDCPKCWKPDDLASDALSQRRTAARCGSFALDPYAQRHARRATRG